MKAAKRIRRQPVQPGKRFQSGEQPFTMRGLRRHERRDRGKQVHAERVWAGGY